MKVIVCGAGQVGFHIARQLAMEANDVTVIDQSEELVRRVSDSMEVQAFVGFASHPDVLERAGAADADMIIAVTYADEVNMVACQVAHSLFNLPTKVARIRHQSYLQPIWADLFSRDHMPIDVIISPEIEVARAISRRLQVPGAFETITFAGGKVKLMGVRCNEDCPVINTPLRQLTGIFPDLNIVVVGIIRDGEGIVPDADQMMLAGDDVYFVADAAHVPRAMAVFGHEETVARRIIIAGGGNIGAFLGQIIEKDHPGVNARIIESNRDRAHVVADMLEKTVVINGNVLDPEILEEVNVADSEAIIAVTNDDETNILASLLAKRFGSRRAVTLINNMTYAPLITTLGIDVVVSPRAITVSSILQHVRRGRIRAVHSLGDGFGEIIEAEILETSSLLGKSIAEADLPGGVLFGAVVRDGEVITPRGDTTLRTNDRVVLFAAAAAVKAVERLFAVRLEFF
ncbi:MAG: Trk system potassium transporter TrkA [Alphaproteobacteria bacterium]|nr:Trk system potassium transporter TrkA [Alphaproteobacteria bacterium]